MGRPKLDSKKINVGFKIDPDLKQKAVEKCLRESLATHTRITLSAKIEELIYHWVKTK
jgi:hypothetical protein